MAVLCLPEFQLPEYVITTEEACELAQRIHRHNPDLKLALRLVRNTGVRKRHLIRSVEETINDTDFERRNDLFVAEAKKRLPAVVDSALANAEVTYADIGAIVFVSCSAYTMPSMTSWMINSLGFAPTTVQLPISQLGCAAGGAAISWAANYCHANPGQSALVVSCEYCSLTYQPTDLSAASLLSNGLFGDATAAAVVRGDGGGTGVRLDARRSYVVPGTTSWISYKVKSTGFHFLLDRGVPEAVKAAMPELQSFVKHQGYEISELDFFMVHTGGPRILDSLRDPGGADPEKLVYSAQTLADAGNVASASVLGAYIRVAPTAKPGDVGIIAGFGPGITMETTFGTWVADGS